MECGLEVRPGRPCVCRPPRCARRRRRVGVHWPRSLSDGQPPPRPRRRRSTLPRGARTAGGVGHRARAGRLRMHGGASRLAGVALARLGSAASGRPRGGAPSPFGDGRAAMRPRRRAAAAGCAAGCPMGAHRGRSDDGWPTGRARWEISSRWEISLVDVGCLAGLHTHSAARVGATARAASGVRGQRLAAGGALGMGRAPGAAHLPRPPSLRRPVRWRPCAPRARRARGGWRRRAPRK